MADGCICNPGWEGDLCDKKCNEGFFGQDCVSECQCKNGGTCDHVTGECKCPTGVFGEFCEDGCPSGRVASFIIIYKYVDHDGNFQKVAGARTAKSGASVAQVEAAAIESSVLASAHLGAMGKIVILGAPSLRLAAGAPRSARVISVARLDVILSGTGFDLTHYNV